MTTSQNRKKYLIGFDLGGTKMMSLIMDTDLNIIGREKKKSKGQNDDSVSTDRIIKVIKSLIEKSETNSKSLAGIGIGVPGTLDLSQGVILEAPNLGWKKIHIKKILEKEFSCPVTVLNDVDAGTYGEYCRGAAQGAHCALGIFPGTGIGGGMVYNNQLFTGKNNSCMEIGHTPVIPDGTLCGCGRYGCLETISSRLAISAAAAAAVYRGEAPALQKISGTNLRSIKSGALAEAIKSGDKIIKDIIVNASYHLGRTIGGVVNLLSPDIIVLGGGLIEAMPTLFLEAIKKSTDETVMPSLLKSYSIVTAKLGDDATAIGAAAFSKKIKEGL